MSNPSKSFFVSWWPKDAAFDDVNRGEHDMDETESASTDSENYGMDEEHPYDGWEKTHQDLDREGLTGEDRSITQGKPVNLNSDL